MFDVVAAILTNKNGFASLRHPSSKVFSVNLSENDFTDAVCSDLSRMVSTNSSLVFVDFSHNKIGDEGVELLASGLLKENRIKTL